MVGAPSEGTKVTKGAPVDQESTGQVTSGSLANESIQRGGEFAENRDVDASGATGTSSSSYAENAKTGASTGASAGSSGAVSGSENPSSSHGSAAPQYVNNLMGAADKTGPHGKNIKEGIDYSNTKDGIQAALNAEPGSEMDPARRAEQQFQQPSLDGGAGARDYKSANEGTTYDALKSDTQA